MREETDMSKWICRSIVLAIFIVVLPILASARGTRYFITWPEGYVGPVYVQVFDIRCNPPYTLLDRFKVWVTWDNQTKCYDIGNRGTYLLKFYKYRELQGSYDSLGECLIVSHKVQPDTALDLTFGTIFE